MRCCDGSWAARRESTGPKAWGRTGDNRAKSQNIARPLHLHADGRSRSGDDPQGHLLDDAARFEHPGDPITGLLGTGFLQRGVARLAAFAGPPAGFPKPGAFTSVRTRSPSTISRSAFAIVQSVTGRCSMLLGRIDGSGSTVAAGGTTVAVVLGTRGSFPTSQCGSEARKASLFEIFAVSSSLKFRYGCRFT